MRIHGNASPPRDVVAYVGLGANLGDAHATLQRAIEECSELPESSLLHRSSFYCTGPIDATGEDFVNAVIALSSRLRPSELLHSLQAIESRHGRERPFRNAPRTLDLDLLLYGDEIIRTPLLTVPHPRLHQRAFALVPLLEICPRVEIPGLGPARALLQGVQGQRIEKLAR